MKIVNLTEFRKLPEGTVYSRYEPCYFTGLFIKGDTLELDYIEMSLIGNVKSHDTGDFLDKCEQPYGNSIPLDFECYGRNGCFEDDQLYAVYERVDVEDLIKTLEQAIK